MEQRLLQYQEEIRLANEALVRYEYKMTEIDNVKIKIKIKL